MAPWNVSDDLTGLVNRSDSGSSYVSLAHTARIIELGGTRSVGPKGDSFESVVTEFQFALLKTELIKKRLTWRTVEQVEWATLRVWWFNNKRLHTEIGNVLPAEIEQEHHAK